MGRELMLLVTCNWFNNVKARNLMLALLSSAFLAELSKDSATEFGFLINVLMNSVVSGVVILWPLSVKNSPRSKMGNTLTIIIRTIVFFVLFVVAVFASSNLTVLNINFGDIFIWDSESGMVGFFMVWGLMNWQFFSFYKFAPRTRAAFLTS